MVALLVSAVSARTAAGAEPPFHISAQNMTGGRGPEGDVLFLNGDLRVTRGRTVLTADNGRYLRATGMIHLEGRVRLVDSTTTVTCDRAVFSETDDRLNLDGNVVIRDKQAELRAPMGWYDRRAGLARLVGGVQGQEQKQRIVADEAVYLRDSSIVQARGRVKGFDEENRVDLSASSVDFDRRTRVAVATGDPVLRQHEEGGRETVVRARRMTVDSRNKTAEAIDSVRVERDTLRASGDYAFFDDAAEYGRVLGRPRAWDNETNVTGDTLELFTVKRRLQRVVVRSNAVLEYRGARVTNLGEASRLVGRRVDLFVHENRIDSLMAVGAARNDYTAPPRAGKTSEENTAQGDTILVYFKDRKIDRARVTGGARGEYRAPVNLGDTTAARAEIIRYDGSHIEYVVPRDQIVLDGDAHLSYRDLQLNARRVVFDSEKQTLVASGKPQLVDKGDQVAGNLMTYDLETRQGTIYKASTTYERGLYHGERIRKSGDDQLDVMNGSYSTCDLDHPHYHFSSRWMKIYLKDKLVAKPVVFYLRNVPILALPFYVFPIKPGRHSGFLFPQFQLGFNNRTGQFLRNAGYYWAPNDYFDVTTTGDYYQLGPQWQLRTEGVYKLLYRLDGRFAGRFNRSEAAGRDDWTFDADHSQEVSPRTRLVARGSFVSSRSFTQSAFSGGTLEERLRRFLVSSVSLSHYADWASVSAYVDRRQDLDADAALEDPDGLGPAKGPAPGARASLANLVESQPSVSLSFPTRTLGSFGVFKDTRMAEALKTTYASLSTRFLSYHERRAFVDRWTYYTRDGVPDSTTVLGQGNLVRRAFQSSGSLSDSRRVAGWLNVTPSVSANTVVFDFDELGNKVVPATAWNAGAGVSTTLYGTFKPPIPGVAGLRHVIFPSLSVNYSPELRGLTFVDTAGVRRNRFSGFGGIGISGFKSANLSFALDQRFQLKLQRGEQVTRLDNLVSWVTAGSYNFLWREVPGLTRGLSPLSTSVRVQPPGYVSADASAAVDPYLGRPLRSLSWNVAGTYGSNLRRTQSQTTALPVESAQPRAEIAPDEVFRDTWQLSLAYSYSGGYLGPQWSSQRTANGVLRWALTPNWNLDYSASYDVTRAEILTQRFALTRRIHCWDATFTRAFTPGGEAEYYFRLGVRDQRELYYERGTRLQSFGGIQ
jgi:lipopolysaccharide assembly outer membrane protein LptD (OstA)